MPLADGELESDRVALLGYARCTETTARHLPDDVRDQLFALWSRALDAADRTGSLDPGLVAIEARRIADGRGPTGVVVERSALRRFDRAAPTLTGYDALLAGSSS